jgi:Peptidase family M23
LNKPYNPGRPFTLTSPYGDRADPNKVNSREFHAGVDYAAPAGTPIPAATSGTVVYSGTNSGFGNTVVVRNATGDYSPYAHMLDGERANVGQQIWPGDTIGQVGSTGEKAKGSHLHYSILPASARDAIENLNLPHNGGPIGIRVNQASTIDPAKYDPQPYIDESRRAAEIFSGLDNKSLPNGARPPGHPGIPFFSTFSQTLPDPATLAQPSTSPNLTPFVDRFGTWGSAPASKEPSVSGDPANFSDRFSDWAIVPGGVLGNVGAAPRVPDPGRRSDVPDGGTPGSATAVAGSAPTPVPVRRLVNLSTSIPSDTPPVAPASSLPSLGIVSGKPMPDYPMRPSIFDTDDRSSPEDNELYQRWKRWVDA